MSRITGYIFFVVFILCSCVPFPTQEPTYQRSSTSTSTSSLYASVEVVESNQSWRPITNDFYGVRMALVPPGCFLMGVTEDQIDYLMGFPSSSMSLEGYSDQLPAHEVCFEEPFWIDVFEVTQAQYTRFMGSDTLMQSFFSGKNLPMESLSWLEAHTFCQQREARLPTEAEWEYAARGPDSALFPWGEIFDCRHGNFDDSEVDDEFLIDGSPECDGYPSTAPVGSHHTGMSWVGALDLSGNVWEWVADKYQSEYYRLLEPGMINPTGPTRSNNHVVRGGAWSINEVDHLSAAFRAGIDPTTSSEHLGFRCAKSFE